MFRYSGGEDSVMTPYLCLENCMGQQLHQRYDKNLVVGITQGTMCLCGYDYELKKAAACKYIAASKTAEPDGALALSLR